MAGAAHLGKGPARGISAWARRWSTRSPGAITVARMCGIVGYVGSQPALDVVVEGLARLEYRGYDSAGTAVSSDGKLTVTKRAGKLANLREALADARPPGGEGDAVSRSGIGHTRWATHGAPNDRN